MNRRYGYRILSGWGLASAMYRGPVALLKFFLRRFAIRAIMRALR